MHPYSLGFYGSSETVVLVFLLFCRFYDSENISIYFPYLKRNHVVVWSPSANTAVCSPESTNPYDQFARISAFYVVRDGITVYQFHLIWSLIRALNKIIKSSFFFNLFLIFKFSYNYNFHQYEGKFSFSFPLNKKNHSWSFNFIFLEQFFHSVLWTYYKLHFRNVNPAFRLGSSRTCQTRNWPRITSVTDQGRPGLLFNYFPTGAFN